MSNDLGNALESAVSDVVETPAVDLAAELELVTQALKDARQRHKKLRGRGYKPEEVSELHGIRFRIDKLELRQWQLRRSIRLGQECRLY